MPLLQIIIFAVMLPIIYGCAGEGVAPKNRDVHLSPKEEDRFLLKVDLNSALPSKEPLDVLLLFDATGSMGNVIDEVRKNAFDIMQSVRGLYENSIFGVAAIYDYIPQKKPWQLYLDFTANTDEVAKGLNEVVLDGGGDWAEAYVRGLYESRFLKWRKDARRYIILFGDAPAHDPEFYSMNYGTDPGRDNKVGTPDDLFLVPVVKQLTGDGIHVISVYDTGGWFNKKPQMDDAIKGFNFISHETGGLSIPIRSAKEVSEAIKAGVRDSFRPKPAIFAPAKYMNWVKTTQAHKRDASNRKFDFDVTLTLPEGTPDGIYRFPLIAMHGGSASGGEIGRTWVTIRVGIANYDWRLPLFGLYFLLLLILLAVKQIRRMHGVDILYFHNFSLWRLGWRIILITALIVLPFMIWKYAPGKLSPSSIVIDTGPIAPVSTVKS